MDQEHKQLLQDIRTLLVLLLNKQEVPGKDIAKALGVDPGTVSRMMSGQRAGKKKGK